MDAAQQYGITPGLSNDWIKNKDNHWKAANFCLKEVGLMILVLGQVFNHKNWTSSVCVVAKFQRNNVDIIV